MDALELMIIILGVSLLVQVAILTLLAFHFFSPQHPLPSDKTYMPRPPLHPSPEKRKPFAISDHRARQLEEQERNKHPISVL